MGAIHTAWYSEHPVDVCKNSWNLILRIDYMEKPRKIEQALSKALPVPIADHNNGCRPFQV